MKRQTFAVWFIIFIVWAFYRAYFHLPDWIDEFLIKPVVFVFPVIFVLVGEKNPLKEMGLWRSLPDFFLDIYLGVLIGLLFALEGMLANFIKYGQFSFAPILALKVSGGIVPLLIINIATSIWEEILGRGFLYQRFYKISNNQFWAATSSSVLFLLLHIPILFTSLHLRGISFLVYPISILLLGITNSYVFTLRKSLTLPILIHAFWNMTVALYL
ncbi:hypothetical protein A2960_05875 [Candidatus Gottesmanbacteria bacterium RIFCSPLOWO2_01_FULL_39_12b]|uniref:CAAX prenyl protease 2/Lysostaphin resistance protein A-like domain-containing protein n=1 Tax=Candidatus Gottesmanbacteria bacterium RIFCSPLOWO2_01_FULL_39_12b TaxID=1798388 RepID=A0A1F6ANK1_9BACT|nr:MAG: hypothetical protein A2960_05875 [Candidatus Gottesmanbacteria bacterium RIFCSPLOWO2_01_FULL_39_12b]